jgi:antitoxin YefM
VVLVSLEDWNALQDTLHLVSCPPNPARLPDLDAGKGVEHALIEP